MTMNHDTTNLPPHRIVSRCGSSRIGLALALALCACDDAEQLAEDPPAADEPRDDEAQDEAREPTLQLGDLGPEVAEAHAYLRRYGYFPNPELAEQYPGWTPVVDVESDDPALFDLSLEEALSTYQESYGLPVTGRLDPATRALMKLPRCGHPDGFTPTRATMPLGAATDSESADRPSAPNDVQAVPAAPSEYKFFPKSSTITELRYGIGQYSTDTPHYVQDTELQAAASTWTAVGPVVFTRRTIRDVHIGFMPHVHGDLKNFDAATLSHESPPNCNPDPSIIGCSTQIHLNDQSYTWGVGNGNTVQDIQSHLLHQLGHALGLDHSADSNAVMYGVFTPGQIRRTLGQDDISAINALYPTFRDLRIYEPQWYLELNPALATAIQNNQKTGSVHWLKFGRNEARPGTPAFDVGYYLSANPSVAQSLGATNYAEAFWHWRESGLNSGLRSSPAFDVKYYLNKWPDLKPALGYPSPVSYGRAMVHWLVHGINEGRSASAEFDPIYYLQNNPSVANIHGLTNYRAGLVHWLTIGRNQGLKAAP